jgi:putative flippase GtrA
MDLDPLPAAPARKLAKLRAHLNWQTMWRIVRYGLTSIIALGISEVTLLVIVAMHLTGATVAAAIASLVGVVPSYLISRYWIWPEADRQRTGRQVALYWAISLVSIAITSFGTGFIAHHTPEKGAAHVAVVGIGFPLINLVLWVAKFFAYQLVVFRQGKPATDDWVVIAAETIDEPGPTDLADARRTDARHARSTAHPQLSGEQLRG